MSKELGTIVKRKNNCQEFVFFDYSKLSPKFPTENINQRR